MKKETLESFIADIVGQSAQNSHQGEFRYFAAPLIGYADASDIIFTEFKADHVIGKHFKVPTEWLPAARTVISFFLPATEHVRKSNYDVQYISDDWLHTRFKGDLFIFELRRQVIGFLKDNGANALAPVLEPGFETDMVNKSSNWSERHVAFAAGLGTFSRNRGLITKNGMAGRFGSVITDLYFEPTKRAYFDPYEYCIQCSACADRCPAHAITDAGQDKELCSAYLANKERNNYNKTLDFPYLACGKCQTHVPCEHQIP